MRVEPEQGYLMSRGERVNSILEKTKAVSNGHFLATSGLHLDTYIDKRVVYMYPEETSELCDMFAEEFKNDNIEVVVAPATGGIILCFETAKALSKLTGKDVKSCFLEKTDDGGLVFKKVFAEQVKRKRALVLDDILTTGGSLKKSIESTKEIEGNVVGVGVICDRSDQDAKPNGVEKYVVLSRKTGLRKYQPAECPMCERGEPLEKRGS